MNELGIQTQARAMKLTKAPEQYPEFVDRWAIIVGISRYHHEQISLKYAHRDAEALYELIQTPSGGGFARDHIVKLVDEEATTANITRALRSFLKKPASSDIILIYFACHGSPDPDRPDIVYLLTHDTDPSDISGTALPMREIDLCLKENLLAERVILVADTCHSAAIGGKIGRRSATDNTAEVNRYLRELSETKPGVALLTSAEASETSQESEKWNGGHGVFTHYLLEGMRGAAAVDGIVRVGDLFDYVRGQVQQETGNKQHPSIGSNSFDRRLPLAVTAGIDAQGHYQLGCGLFDLGRRLRDTDLVSAAHAQLREAARLRSLNQEVYPEAQLLQGRIGLEQGDYAAAIRLFQRITLEHPSFDAYFHLGLGFARQGNVAKATQAFEQALSLDPDDKRRGWVDHYLATLRAQRGGAFYVLMIGVNFREQGEFPGHLGYLRKLLMTKYGVSKDAIQGLVNENATYQNVLQAFATLRQRVTPADTVLVYYSGNSLPEQWESCLELFDTTYRFSDEAANALSARDLHAFMDSLPTNRKTLAGVMPNRRLFTLARDSNRYALFTRASLEQQDWDHTFDDGVRSSLFVHSFFHQLAQETTNLEETTYSDIIAGIQAEAQTTALDQTPLFMGDPNRLLFSGTGTDLALLDIMEQFNYATLSLDAIRREYHTFQEVNIAFPQAYQSFGNAFLAKRAFPEALTALMKAKKQSRENTLIELELAMVQLGSKDIQSAIDHLTHFLEKPAPSALDGQVKQLCEDLHTWMEQKPIVLVGIDRYASHDLPTLQGAVNDVMVMKHLLISHYGYREEEITVLLNEKATYEAITSAFTRSVKKAESVFSLFYFSGIGSKTKEHLPTIVSHDGRQPGIYDIALTDLATQATNPSSRLITIIDVGWTAQINAHSNNRTISTDIRPSVTHRAVNLIRATGATPRIPEVNLQIGQVTIFTRSLDKYALGSPIEELLPEIDGDDEQIHGSMTHQLLQRLAAADSNSFTFADFITIPPKSTQLKAEDDVAISTEAKTNDKLPSHDKAWFVVPRLSEDLLHTPVFIDTKWQNLFIERMATLAYIDQTNEMVDILKRMIEQRKDSYPEGHFYLGVAHLVRREHAEAINALEKAIAQREGSFAAAHYYLGRTLFESEVDLARAESELRLATKQDPENTAVLYFLGQAIRKRIEQESMIEAESALRTYLERGAPLGNQPEVEAFLATR